MKSVQIIKALACFLIINTQVLAQSGSSGLCIDKTSYGNLELCLPEITGMKNAYDLPKVKELADTFEDSRNMVLAFYLNDETYTQADRIDEIAYDDYFKFYANRQFANKDISSKEFKQFASVISSQFTTSNWNEIKTGVEDKLEGLTVGVPTIVKDVPVKDDEKTLVLLVRYSVDGQDSLITMAMSLMRIKQRLIFMAYYKEYASEETIDEVLLKSNLITQSLKQANH